MATKGRTPDEIRAELAASRHALSVGVEGLVSELHPTALKNRAQEEAQQVADDVKEAALDKVRGVVRYFYDEGGVRWNNVGTVAMVVVGAGLVIGTSRGLLNAVQAVFSR